MLNFFQKKLFKKNKIFKTKKYFSKFCYHHNRTHTHTHTLIDPSLGYFSSERRKTKFWNIFFFFFDRWGRKSLLHFTNWIHFNSMIQNRSVFQRFWWCLLFCMNKQNKTDEEREICNGKRKRWAPWRWWNKKKQNEIRKTKKINW